MLLMLTAVQAVAQDDKVSFTAQAPDAVVVGDRFRISYKINTNNAKEFRAPDMKSLSVLTGPSTSTQSRTTIVNGKSSHEVTITYTYMVVATEEGTVDLDGATILVKGDQYTSNKLSIRVLPQDQTGQGSSSGAQQNWRSRVMEARMSMALVPSAESLALTLAGMDSPEEAAPDLLLPLVPAPEGIDKG